MHWLVEEIRRRKRPDRPLKVGIDGRCGSGKTSLADSLALRLRKDGFEVLRPSIDGFHHPKAYRYRQGEYSATGYYEDAFDHMAVVTCLLEPLSGSTFPILCHRASHDLRTDVAIDSTISVSCGAVLLFDGVFLFRRELNAYRKKNAFPFIDLKRGQLIPKKSLTERFSGTGDGCSNTGEAEPSFWISKQLKRSTAMYEQVLVQGKGYRITLLTIDEEEAQDDDEEYARDRSEWRPGLR